MNLRPPENLKLPGNENAFSAFYSRRMGLDPAVLNAKPQNSPAA
jgi:hypothetical protein